jgi:hypothetical protein
MKRGYFSVMVMGVSLCFLATTAIYAAESKKTDSYKDRLAKQAETYDAEGEKKDTQDKQEVQRYPQATRKPVSEKGTPGLVKLRNQMVIAFQKGKDEDAKLAAEKLETDKSANANDRATAIQVKLFLVTKKDNNNHAAAIPLLEDAIATDGLSNNDHFGMLQQLAQRYLLDQDYENALEKADKFINETKTETKEILVVKGNSLFRLKKLKESASVLEKAHALDSADVPVTEMLARAYAETGQLEKAAFLTKTLAQVSGNDRASKINLAITYRDAKQYEQAADIVADLRQSKQLLEERDYLTAINIYSAMKKKENDMVEVVQEGLDKGILQPTASNYNILAEAYYYSGRDDAANKAIANWQKAAPISKNGAIYLNLSIVQCQEERWADCKESAKNAIAKGGINANDAKSQINKADQELAKSR